MADINISINQESDTYTITLDKWEWTGLSVNGNVINPINQGNIQFQYKQSSAETIHFIATANQYIDLINSGNPMYLKGAKNTYICIISYQETENPKEVTLHGVLTTVSAAIPGAENSPLRFSQGRMTGTFQD
ncbi:MAG: hypothetical protein AB8B78_04835 [Polaribacter sp.]